jgi:hypothetical protein
MRVGDTTPETSEREDSPDRTRGLPFSDASPCCRLPEAFTGSCDVDLLDFRDHSQSNIDVVLVR